MRKEISEKINASKTIASFVNMHISDHEIKDILSAISRELSVLNLNDNDLTNQGAKILSENLHVFGKLKKLCLQNNKIGREGAIELFREKSKFPELEILFYGNGICSNDEMSVIEKEAANLGPRP